MVDSELTGEQAAEIGRSWGNAWLKTLPIEKRLAGLSIEERGIGLTQAEIENFLQKYLKQMERKRMSEENSETV